MSKAHVHILHWQHVHTYTHMYYIHPQYMCAHILCHLQHAHTLYLQFTHAYTLYTTLTVHAYKHTVMPKAHVNKQFCPH